MPAYILVRAIDGWDDPMSWQTGYPVMVSDRDQIGGKQSPPNFCQVVITDRTPDQVVNYLEEWQRSIDYEFVAHDYSIDGHRLRVFTKPEEVSASGIGGLTRDKVESFLNTWSASVVSIAANEVVFDLTVAGAVQSDGFWDRDVSLIDFTETDYNQATGIHTTRANYSGDPETSSDTQEKINAYIARRGGTVTQHLPNGRVTFDISRGSVFDVFKQDVKAKTDGVFARRKWYFTQAGVDQALAAGGSVSVTYQQALNYLHNRLLD